MRHRRRFRCHLLSLSTLAGLTAFAASLAGCRSSTTASSVPSVAPLKPVAQKKPAEQAKPISAAPNALPASVRDKSVPAEWTGELPTPPQQNAPWTPPSETGLPSGLPKTAQILFTQGVADPRGGEYQAITVRVGNVWRGDGGTVETHGWVLPEEIQEQKFAVCWNGLVYPVVAVTGRADLQADVNNVVGKATGQKAGRDYTLYWSHATPEAQSLSLHYPSLLKAVLLLRLGKNDLAQKLADVWRGGTTPHVNGNDDILRDPYLFLASQWTWSVYERAVCAHMRGADALALADANRLTRVQPLIEGEAAKRGYKTYVNGGVHQPGAPFLTFLGNLPELQKDAARRAAETPRPPLDVAALKNKKPSERIDALIVRLDDVAARQDGQPGGVGLDADPISEALIAEGEQAVEPLLDTMERDTRLTRSVSFPRDFFQTRNLLTVKSAAFACFVRITQLSEIRGQDGKERDVAALRAWWSKNKGASPADRWLAQLADDGPPIPASPAPPAPGTPRDWRAEQQEHQRGFERTRNNARRWEEAAERIVERANVRHQGVWVSETPQEPGKALPPFKGEPLRARKNPSVSDLLQKRALQLSEPQEGKWGFDYTSGARFALILYEWEPRGAQTLPTLQEVMRRCFAFENGQSRREGYSDQYQMGGRIARLTLARVRLGDNAAANEYKTYLQSVSPAYLGSESDSALYVLWKGWGNPALRRVADALFAPTPPSEWNKLLSDPKKRGNSYTEQLFGSPMLRFASFRALVLRRLSDTTPAGTAVQTGGAYPSLRFNWNDGSQTSMGALPGAKNARQTLRIGDRAAIALQRLAGVPLFDPVAPIEARDKACREIAAYLKTWGDALGNSAEQSYPKPLYSYDMGDRFSYFGPTFPALDHPAMESDVRQNRAIFHLSGQKTRIAPDLAVPLPIEAGWKNDPNGSPSRLQNGKQTRFSTGMVWQAEDEWNGKTWTRYYGYVGPHGLYKVPASEIEFRDYRVFAVQKAQALKPK